MQVETIGELISYYKDIFTLLSSCAARQLEEITFRRGVVKAGELADYAARYIKRAGKRMPHRGGRRWNMFPYWEMSFS